MRPEELKGHLDALLLAALEDGPRHGYTVIEVLSGKRAEWRDFADMISGALEGKPWPNPA